MELFATRRQHVVDFDALRAQPERLFWFSIVLLLAVISPLQVVKYGWLKEEPGPFLRAAWCAIPRFCQLILPPYFLWIIPAFLGLLAVFAWRRPEMKDLLAEQSRSSPQTYFAVGVGTKQRQAGVVLRVLGILGVGVSLVLAMQQDRLPGWNFALSCLALLVGFLLQDVPLVAAASMIRRNFEWLTLSLVIHISLLGVLANYYIRPGPRWVNIVVFLTACILLLVLLCHRGHRPGRSFWLITIALLVYTIGVNDWCYSSIGDEFAFYRYGDDIVQHYNVATIGDRLFYGQAAYGAHPFFSSLLQAISMYAFGSNSFGWHFSSIYLSALSIGIFHLFFRAFLRPNLALGAAFLLLGSHYIMAFSKIGYNNLQALFAMALALWASSWAIQTKRPVAFVLTGAALALCCYVYPAAFYVIPVAVLLLAFYDPPRSRLAITRWGEMIATAAVMVAPLFLQFGYWQAKLPGLYANPDRVSSEHSFSFHLVTNLLYSLFSMLYIQEDSHFVAIAYVDPVTAALILVGLAYVATQIGRDRFSSFVVASFAILLLLVGASHDRLYPPNTRMFLLLPWFALFAAVALGWLGKELQHMGLSGWLTTSLAMALVLGVIMLNTYQAYDLSVRRSAGRYQQYQSVFLGFAEKILNRPGAEVTSFLFLNDPSTVHIDSLRELLRIYSVPFNSHQMAEAVVSGPELTPDAEKATREGKPVVIMDPQPELPPDAEKTIRDGNTLVFVNPKVEATWPGAFDAILAQAGKSRCTVTTTEGEPRVTVWMVGGCRQ